MNTLKAFNTLTLSEAIALLKSHQLSHADLYRAVHDVIADKNHELNVYLALDHEALAKTDKLLDTPLAGVPIAVKMNFLTVGLESNASSKVLSGYMPQYESTVTARLKHAGGVIVGKTNMDAWAHGSSTETSDFGATKNPRNPSYLPGGSSGGSAAAVAGDMCIAALGSETAGSIRQPSAWCGAVGAKPTYGRVSRYGVIAMGSSLDSPGPMGKTVRDCALLLNVIAGSDPFDATTGDIPVPDFTRGIEKGVKGMRIGLCYIDHPKLKGSPVDAAVREAGKTFVRLGAKVDTIAMSEQLKPGKILSPDHAVGVYTVVQRSEVSSNLARYDGVRYGQDRSHFGEEAKRRILLGTFTLTKGYAERYYLHAQKVRSLYIKNFEDLFSKFDLLISPTSPGYALPLGATKGNPMFGELEDLLLEPTSIAGLPGVNVPCWRDPRTSLYLGLNIVANYWQEEIMLRAAYAFEQATQWNSWKT